MHTGPISETKGDLGDEKKSSCPCPKCGADENYYQVWESSCGGYEDYKHHCKACGHRWWVDGIDT